MKIDTQKLKDKIDESGYRWNWIAKQLNLSPYGLRQKVNGNTKFYVEEMRKLCDILKISSQESEEIF